MHDTALVSGAAAARLLVQPGMLVVDVGGYDVNGTLKPAFVSQGARYVSVDMEAHPSVDVVVKPGEPLPFEDGSVDGVISSSMLEHDPCFWMTFREMCRITKIGGFIYANAPGRGSYHGFPGDNWRFYYDAGQAWRTQIIYQNAKKLDRYMLIQR